MLGPTHIQILERQNKDLRIRLGNRQVKAELSLFAMESEREELKTQVCDKDKVIAMLQKETGILTGELKTARDLRQETIQERIDAAVAEQVAPLLEELDKAYLEIGRLKAIIGKDSSNSSKPPSKDGFKQIQNSREPSSRPKGGQKGHPGHRLSLPDDMERLVEKGFVKKRVIDHSGGSSEYISRYVIDVEVVTTVTEHRYAIGAQLPKNLYNEVSYGENIRNMSVLLLNEGVIAEKRFSEILTGLTHGAVNISPATLEKFLAQFAQKLESNGELDAIKEDLLNGNVIHTDDTSLRTSQTIEYLDDGKQRLIETEKKSHRATIRTHSNERSAYYTVNPKKDKDGIERDDLLTKFIGILSHDHESKFYNYGTFHATCGEHLLRDLKGLQDLLNIPWAGKMRGHMARMNRHKNKDREEGKNACDPAILSSFEQEYDDLIGQGREEHGMMKKNELGRDDLNVMLNRLTNHKDCYLLFMRDYKAPFTNNLAERDLRAEKTKEKVSLLFRSWNGLKNHTRIRSFVSTVKKRKMDLFLAITQVNASIPVLR
jgi:hypothetical protein